MNRPAVRTIIVWSVSFAILAGAAGLKWVATAEPRLGPVFIAGDRAVTEDQVRSKLQEDGCNRPADHLVGRVSERHASPIVPV